jgi:nucleoside-diphosphate-sugar epimerase
MIFLVTGCSSYIAKYVIKKLLADEYKVFGISRTNPNIINRNFYWLAHDLSKSPCKINTSSVDIIIHMAAQSLLNKSAIEYLNSNILLTYHVSKMAAELKPKAVIYTSSMKVYGDIREKTATEETDIINPELYGQTKYFGEKLLQETVFTISLRMPGVIAVGSHGWVDSIYHKLKKNESLVIYNAPYNHVVHAYDLYGIIRQICSTEYYKNDVFNVCANGVTTSLGIVEFIKNAVSSKSPIELRDNRNAISHVISNKKLLNIYNPMDIKDSLKLYVKEMLASKKEKDENN